MSLESSSSMGTLARTATAPRRVSSFGAPPPPPPEPPPPPPPAPPPALATLPAVPCASLVVLCTSFVADVAPCTALVPAPTVAHAKGSRPSTGTKANLNRATNSMTNDPFARKGQTGGQTTTVSRSLSATEKQVKYERHRRRREISHLNPRATLDYTCRSQTEIVIADPLPAGDASGRRSGEMMANRPPVADGGPPPPAALPPQKTVLFASPTSPAPVRPPPQSLKPLAPPPPPPATWPRWVIGFVIMLATASMTAVASAYLLPKKAVVAAVTPAPPPPLRRRRSPESSSAPCRPTPR